MKKSMLTVGVLLMLAGICGCSSVNNDTETVKVNPETQVEVKAEKNAVQPKAAVRPVKTAIRAEKTVVPQVTIHLAGDSTCANYSAKRTPIVGWGQVLNEFCKAGVRINNKAVSGSSSTSFIQKKRWAALMNQVKPGDYVIIQFGHNDGKKGSRYADAKSTYPANLKKFIADVRAKQANPVIATSISRCIFKSGKIAPSGLERYRNAAIAVAKAENVPVLDLNRITADKFNAMGEKKAFALFRGTYEVTPRKTALKTKPIARTISPEQVAAAANNSPAGAERVVRPAVRRTTDRTHLIRSGALAVADWFVAECKAQKLPIADCFK